ncbi:hypothetical protein JI664_21500 [Rhodobacter sp. NTK016B]|uniref:hypothetical protein n=1 Tax=Rhodobacter sp. NTK016B TaxID=2759676 RepID=UPI001A8D0EE4|nr:hypothetical protein [Rhodobacter sp. NTK016B]MBN8294563.1 hypothetical protein [Rhodobacter sp. NTK016B]
MFIDKTGWAHESREAAIAASFQNDVQNACEEIVAKHVNISPRDAERAVRMFIETNPDIVRVLLGEREAT